MLDASIHEHNTSQWLVQFRVGPALARAVKFGRPPMDPQNIARYLRTVEDLIEAEELSLIDTAKTIGWSEASYYRHLLNSGFWNR
ncbi:MAG: hypothetical protein L0J68_04920 [Micrococcaceae bacterium]|nr:hypothetical protein [Micrococcaceae bacterium]